jgi:uncharacterized protein (UPF0335 family)
MAADRLRSFVERIERLIEERSSISGDIRDVYSQAKAEGFDASVIRRLIARRRMDASEREEADSLVAAYEAALGMAPGEPSAALVDSRPDAAAIALELLTAEIVALEDSAQAAALVDHVLTLLDIRAEIAVLRTQERERRALAKGEGFDAKQIAITVRWFEKVAKHGEEAMRAGEATFHLYRGTVEGHRAKDGMATERDSALFDKFAGSPAPAPTKLSAKDKALQEALAWAGTSSKGRSR